MKASQSSLSAGRVSGRFGNRRAGQGSCSGLRSRAAGSHGGAFTFVELLVVIGMVALGAAMLAPALARTRTASPALRCLNNARQMALGWTMYADDNSGLVAPNFDGTTAGQTPTTPAWVAGWLDYTPTRPDNTNTLMLVDHNRYPNGAFLGPYVRDPAIFKCPADHSSIMLAQVSLPRVRSVSMNSYTGNTSRTWTSPSRYTVCRKLSQILSPAIMFVTLDEHEASINDGCFWTNPDTLYNLIDYPASYHGNAGGFSFADGHSEIHKWRDPRTYPVVQPGQTLPLNMLFPGDTDVVWLAQHAVGAKVYP